MAENWIKLRKALRTDPRVLIMAATLKRSRAEIIGGLFLLWAIADEHGETLPKSLTHSVLNAEIGIESFCESLPRCWLSKRRGALHFPRYDEHNGSTARTRAVTAQRVRAHRAAKATVTSNANGNATSNAENTSVTLLDQTRPEPDQKREEKKPPQPTNHDLSAICAYTKDAIGFKIERRLAGELLTDFGLAVVVEALEHLASRRPTERFKDIKSRPAFIKSLVKRAEGDGYGALGREAFEFEPFDDWRARIDEAVAGVS